MSPNSEEDVRIGALERRVNALEPKVDDALLQLAGVRNDIGHVVDGAGRIASSVEKLADTLNAKMVADGAAAALVSSDLSHLKAGVAALTTERAARQWPPAAKAAIYAAGLAAAAQVASALAGHPVL